MVTIYAVIPVVLGALTLGFYLGSLHFSSGCKTCQIDFHELLGKSGVSVGAFLSDVSTEIDRAKRLHPGNSHLVVALMEEVGELAKCFLEGESSARVWVEAKHVACVASRIATEWDGDFNRPIVPVVPSNYVDSHVDDCLWPDPPSRTRVGA